MNSIYWHDYETTGIDPARDRPLQFAGLRTDENLEEIGEPLTLYCRPPRDRLPNPVACLVTGITPQEADSRGVPEPEFIARIVEELSRPGTCGAGYNSLRFDDEVTRYTLYRNFFDPYEREWKHGNSRWDIIDMLRLTRALRPEGIHWPEGENGGTSFKLEHLTAANGIAHEAAHDALSDVRATIAMARLVRDKQPKLYQYVYEHRLKHQAARLIDLAARKPVLHVSSRLPRENGYTALMIPLCQHPVNKNAVIAYNLSADPAPLLELDAASIRERLFTPAGELPETVARIPLKAIHLNRCPVLATPKLLDNEAARRLGIDLSACEDHWYRLKGADLAKKLGEVFALPPMDADTDAELALYAGFLDNADRDLLPAVREASPDELAAGTFPFRDSRYRELLFRYRARFYPQTLGAEEQHQWEEFRYRQLTEPGDGYLSMDEYHQSIDRLEADPALSNRDRATLAALREWGDSLL
jgi:exodeoxyribonuclease-1